MDIIKASAASRPLIEAKIKKYGYAPEHNFFHFMNWERKGEINHLFDFGDKSAILARLENRIWYIFSEILAKPKNKLTILSEFLDFCFSDPKIKKVVVEFETEFCQQVLKFLKSAAYRACRTNYSLTWPIFGLDRWDPDLKGGEWKKMRYQVNLFHRQHQVEIVNSNDCDKKELKKIVEAWRKTRGGRDRSHFYPYLNLIDNNFAGAKFRRTFMVDGAPATITAGWEIPNRPGWYYSAIGLHNYQCDYLGEAANIDDLSFLKKQGYQFANFGGGEKDLTDFKIKFRPQTTYQTHIFSIKRR